LEVGHKGIYQNHNYYGDGEAKNFRVKTFLM